MKYEVIWRPIAEQRLAQLWLSASDRPAVTQAANAIDAAMERDPLNLGESRLDTTRVVFEGPLGVLFDVHAKQRRVAVLDVWRCR